MKNIFFRNFDFKTALTRFWPAILCSIIGSICLIIAVDHTDGGVVMMKGTICSLMAMLAFINLQISNERYRLKMPVQILIGVLILGLCGLYYWLLPNEIKSYTFGITYRSIGIIMILHLLISIFPYLGKGSIQDFWVYNKSLLLNFLESFFNAFILFLGLTVALLALKFLFDIDFDSIVFLQLFIFLIGIFQTFYFLSRFPKTYDDFALEAPSKGFKVLSQFILIPLVAIYLVILYAYGVKILAAFQLPKGWVSNLVLWFSVVGVLAYLLNYCNDRFADFELSKQYKKWFFYFIPLPLIMLFIAIWRRINDYGVTENRYIVALLSVWLASIVIYFIVSKKDNIKMIPISLAAFLLFGLASPWNFYSVSSKSQSKRLMGLFGEAGLLTNGKLAKAEKTLDSKLSRELMTQVHYLSRRDQLKFLNQHEVFNNDDTRILNHEERKSSRRNNTDENQKRVAAALNIKYTSYRSSAYDIEYFNFQSSNEVLNIEGYDEMLQIQCNQSIYREERTLCIVVLEENILKLSRGDEVLAELDLSDFILRLKDLPNGEIETKKMIFESEDAGFKFCFNHIYGHKDGDGMKLVNADGFLLMKKK